MLRSTKSIATGATGTTHTGDTMNTTTQAELASQTTRDAIAKFAERSSVASVELVASAEQGAYHFAAVDITWTDGRKTRSLIDDGSTHYQCPTGEGAALMRKLV